MFVLNSNSVFQSLYRINSLFLIKKTFRIYIDGRFGFGCDNSTIFGKQWNVI